MLLSITKILTYRCHWRSYLSSCSWFVSILGFRTSHCRPELGFYLSQLPCKQIIFTWSHIIPRSLTISLAFVDLPYFLFFVHKRQDFRKNVSDNMDILFSTVIWSILNPWKIRWGVIKFCWSLCGVIIMRFELNLKVVDVLLKVPTINLHEKYVQWKASRFMRRAYLPKTFSPLPFCEGTQQTEAPSEHQSLCSDGHPPIRL